MPTWTEAAEDAGTHRLGTRIDYSYLDGKSDAEIIAICESAPGSQAAAAERGAALEVARVRGLRGRFFNATPAAVEEDWS